MSNNLLVSIAMTCYNHSPFIVDAIESLVKQTYTNWELVIIDDYSTDNAQIIIKNCVKKFKIKNKTKVFVNLENRGYGYSLDKAINESSGELVVILDSDDALAINDALKICVDIHRKNPDVALTYSNYNECNEQLKKIKFHKTRQLEKGENFLNSGKRLKISHLKVIKKKFYNMTEGINPKLKQTVDKDLFLKIEEVGKLLFIDEILLNYRFHNNNISRIAKKKCSKYQKLVNETRNQIYRDAKKRREIK